MAQAGACVYVYRTEADLQSGDESVIVVRLGQEHGHLSKKQHQSCASYLHMKPSYIARRRMGLPAPVVQNNCHEKLQGMQARSGAPQQGAMPHNTSHRSRARCRTTQGHVRCQSSVWYDLSLYDFLSCECGAHCLVDYVLAVTRTSLKAPNAHKMRIPAFGD